MSLVDPEEAARLEMIENIAVLERMRNIGDTVAAFDPVGRATLSPDLLDALREIFPAHRAERLFESLSTYADSGMLGLDEGSVWIPWRAMEEVARGLGGVPPALQQVLDVDPSDLDQLHAKYPSMDHRLFTEETARLLTREPANPFRHGVDVSMLPSDPSPDPGTPTPQGGGGPPAPAPPPSAGDYLSIARCLVGGSWGPYFPGPVGWTAGCSVSINYQCADALSLALLQWFVPTPLTLGPALIAGIRELSIEAGIQTLGSTAGAWIAVAAFATGAQIQIANLHSERRGVIVYFPWPSTPLPVFATSR